jgi:hypothetical protein
MNSGNRGVVQLTWKFLACASVIVALLVTGHVQAQKPAISIPSPATGKSQRPQPLKLKTLYDVKERIAQAGGGADVVVCDLTFEFTNTLPIPIRIAFPPVGVFFGGQVSFAKADNPDTPIFARTNEIVELKPNETRTYVSKGHTIVGLPGEYEWVFGLPSQGSLPENMFVGSVYSVPKQR